MAPLFPKIRKKSSIKLENRKPRWRLIRSRSRRIESRRRPLFLRRPPAMYLCRLACPRRRLASQAFDLASRQGDADLADPFELYPVDRLGVEACGVDLG